MTDKWYPSDPMLPRPGETTEEVTARMACPSPWADTRTEENRKLSQALEDIYHTMHKRLHSLPLSSGDLDDACDAACDALKMSLLQGLQTKWLAEWQSLKAADGNIRNLSFDERIKRWLGAMEAIPPVQGAVLEQTRLEMKAHLMTYRGGKP